MKQMLLCFGDLDVCPTSPHVEQLGWGRFGAIVGTLAFYGRCCGCCLSLKVGVILWQDHFGMSEHACSNLTGFSIHFAIESPSFHSNNSQLSAFIWWTDGILITHEKPTHQEMKFWSAEWARYQGTSADLSETFLNPSLIELHLSWCSVMIREFHNSLRPLG